MNITEQHITEILHEPDPGLTLRPDAAQLAIAAGRRRRHRRAGALAVAVVMAVGVAVGVFVTGPEDRSPVAEGEDPPLVAVDGDTWLRARDAGEPPDTPYFRSIWRVHFSGETFTVPGEEVFNVIGSVPGGLLGMSEYVGLGVMELGSVQTTSLIPVGELGEFHAAHFSPDRSQVALWSDSDVVIVDVGASGPESAIVDRSPLPRGLGLTAWVGDWVVATSEDGRRARWWRAGEGSWTTVELDGRPVSWNDGPGVLVTRDQCVRYVDLGASSDGQSGPCLDLGSAARSAAAEAVISPDGDIAAVPVPSGGSETVRLVPTDGGEAVDVANIRGLGDIAWDGDAVVFTVDAGTKDQQGVARCNIEGPSSCQRVVEPTTSDLGGLQWLGPQGPAWSSGGYSQ